MTLRIFLGAILALSLTGVASASEYIADSSEEEHVPVVVRDVFLNEESARRAMQADIAFARNMARHHQGAVDMAKAYLHDPRGTNPVVQRLARAIIHNQAFEIAVLDVVRQHAEAGPRPIARIGGRQLVSLSRGVDGLEHEWMFVRAPAPSVADLWLSQARVSDFDVQFARPMIEHHGAALDMAMKYNTNPNGKNSVLGPMNTGIMVDQSYEIGFLQRLIQRYPGDASSVPDDPRMMEMMKASMSGMEHGHGGHRSGH
jgi:uncharacterized protein (DUF305 family)